MKKIINSTLFVVAFVWQATAQCSPDPQYTSVGFHPDSTEGLPIACENIAYQETITIISPVDTVISGFTVAVDSVRITGISGLPGGMAGDCQNPNCTWYPQTNSASCISINGTPVVGSGGTYTLLIEYEVCATLFGFPQFFPLSEDYTFEVQGCAAIDELKPKAKELVKITDLMGREILPQPGIPVLYHYTDGSVDKIIRIQE